MPKERSRLNSLLHSLPSFNKSDRLSIKVAHLLNLEENTPDEDMSYTIDRRRCSPHRRSLGGRGREWASESLKLLEALLELDDSKPVREPVNPLKYPEYYSLVPNPLDLSKIMLKFHGGSYPTLESFARDMRSMFNNYKAFFKDASSEIYTQVHRLSWWFEAELTRIDDKWGRVRKTPVINANLTRETPALQRPSKGPDREVLSAAPVVPVISDVHSVRDSTPLYLEEPEFRKRKKKGRKIIHMDTPVQEASEEPGSSSVPQPVQISSLVASELGTQSASPEQFSLSLARLKPGTVAQLLGTKRSLVSSSKGSPDIHTDPNSPAAWGNESMPGTSRGSSANPDLKSSRLPLSSMSLSLSVSNIWFGMARIKPKKEAMLSEAGLQLSLHSGEVETQFAIPSEEIVRCVAHFGRTSNKHTLFLFVLPSCMKRLEAMNPKYANSSMIVIFMSAASQTQISTLVHIFWTIGKNSLFGPVFTEVDQQGALTLLGNIKPGIMSRVASKYKSSSTSQSGEPNTTQSRPETSQSSLPVTKRRKLSQDGIPNFQLLQEQERQVETQEENSAQKEKEQTAEVESSVMPDSSMSLGQEDGQEGQNMPVQRFDEDFAERLGARLQKGFKDGFTEVIKNLTDSLYGKRLPTDSHGDESGTEAGNHGADDNQGGESDIEIIIPTDSEDEEKPKAEICLDNTDRVAEGEDLAVTMETPRIRCPITQQIMKRPLKNKYCNHCYDMQGVEELIKNRKQKARCPVAGCSNTRPLHLLDMKYDHELFKYIKEKTNPDALDLSSVDKQSASDSE